MRLPCLLAVVLLLCSRVSAEPAAIVVVIDRSMPPEKLEVVTHSLAASLGAFAPGDRLGVVAFAKAARVQVPLQRVRVDERMSAQLDSLTYAEGGDLSVGLRAAAEVLAGAKESRKHVVVITERDGVAGVRPVIAKMRDAGISVSSIGFQSLNRRALDAISTQGGGATRVVQNGVDVGRTIAALHPREAADGIAVVFLIDRSASMTDGRLASAKELVRMMIDALAPTDQVAVLGVDHDSSVIVKPQWAANRQLFADDLGRVESGGASDWYSGFEEGFEVLHRIDAKVKRLIFISDGDAPTTGLPELLALMRADGVVVSVVAAANADLRTLSSIVDAGTGRLYVSADVVQLRKLFQPSVPQN
jgi:Mg-chelatase subunit ChlD